MGNAHPFNVLRPLPGLMTFLIERRIRFTSPEYCLGGSEHYGSILGGVPSNYIHSGSNPPSYAHSPLFLLEPTLVPVSQFRFAASSWNAVLAKVVYTTTGLVYRLCARIHYPLISLTIQ